MRVEVPRADVRNPTTRTGKIVHAPSEKRPTYPKCRVFMDGLMYTDEPVNCPRCMGR